MISAFEADNIYGSFENQHIIANIRDRFYLLSSDGSKETVLPFTYILNPQSNSYWWSLQKDSDKLKSILEGQRRTETSDFYPFDEITEFSGKWGIISDSGQTLIDPIYDYIDFFGLSDNFKVFSGNLNFKIDDSNRTVLSGHKCGVVDSSGRVIIPIIYDWITEIAEGLWAVNRGGEVFYNDEYQEDYWTVREGKWGVINAESKIVVPVVYDCIMTNWFRVKDLIFVQQNTESFDGEKEYEVYDSIGNKIIKDIPDYKDHIYYKE